MNTDPLQQPTDNDLGDFVKTVQGLTPEDFDGHTDFMKLTPDDKLIWLSNAARFFFQQHSTGKLEQDTGL